MTLEAVATPVLGPGEVLLEVESAGMNRSDLLHTAGRYRQRAFAHPDRPDVPGSELLGHVVEVHPTVHGIAAGDRAFALTSRAHADYVAVDARLLLPARPGDADSLGAMAMASMTAFDALVRLGGLASGHNVLITGASSGVGLVALGLARAWGAGSVVATSRSPETADLLREHGATSVAHDESEVTTIGRQVGFDLVVDHVGGTVLEAAVTGLRDRATVVSVGRLGGRTATIDLVDLAGRRASLIGTTWKTRHLDEIADVAARVRAEVLPLVHRGEITVPVAHRIPFEEIDQAYRLLASGYRKPGRILIERNGHQRGRRAPS
ncbi:hypothetical protein AD006_28415 (plasmid) [Pseudonocardia sp. EC080610-09]|nr:hypothetical protein AD006_28415 [Pseudonocardia sp. EC080610-09]ALL85708.1 hypothetical protein AD017_28805 [Pseudonocardia sp. EC080619-01]